MRYVLDTNLVSRAMKGDASILLRMRGAGRPELGLPQPVIAELAYGIERLPRSRRKDMLKERLESVCAELPRVTWTDEVSESFAQIKAGLERRGERIEDFDLAIAAHALAHGAILVTADRRHMPRIAGLVVEDWAAD
jgi:tRNA(fMet)-specific endonuclease VapC